MYILFHQFSFLMTGLVTTFGCQWLFYKGAATGDSYLTQLFSYIGMVLVIFLVPSIKRGKMAQYELVQHHDPDDIDMQNLQPDDDEKSKRPFEEGPIHHPSIIKLSLLDTFANFCVTMGFSIVGSGMYQVIYSSVVIWCAILSYFLMGRRLTQVQWIAIFGTSAGLTLSSLDNFGPSTDADSASTTLLMMGTMMTVGGTFFYACLYVYADYLLSKQSPPALPARVCAYVGMYTTSISILWISVYTLPRVDQMIQIHDTNSSTVWMMYALVALGSGTHAWNYYELIDRTGSVATGILQGLRAVIVYGLSHLWYCSTDSAQCFTVYKGLGSLMVILCVLIFTVGGPSK
ncbi:hypothetical protein DM01DRAFT_1310818 [Hesseltinella vesiculosa]|uniref:EamA domain-containing protein n=1 Tax=Hesseltinella vesiculosa TaxID=101127 RepID=A0A1X2G6Z2_9FUNG|nr:hypothetical protein DM01DRAFT_1310818 [Hesseltinella vesiculosa]